MKRTALCPVTGLMFAAAPPLSVGGKPDFSGTWTLDLERSQLQADLGIQGGTFTIDHKELSFRFSWVADRKRRSLGALCPSPFPPLPRGAVAGLAAAPVLS